ncbi:hypothetical protein [Herbaspirillum sp. ST 5-3]|uniref:hypothetical protein n=1 Tax=Oxalobacteraceae TaxID=75682 RepID=UPI0010A59907|nr:hypothetical protein [Herbaspirillum sp. ST 5-3]
MNFENLKKRLREDHPLDAPTEEAVDAIEQLQRNMRETLSREANDYNELLAEKERIERELEEARRDAERYRWLRKNWHNIQIGFDGPNIDCLSLETRSGHAREMKDIVGFNEAIDEARGAITPTLICPSCGVDRYKEKCKGSLQNCPIQAIAHNAARQQNS